jgi:hypothetical protein
MGFGLGATSAAGSASTRYVASLQTTPYTKRTIFASPLVDPGYPVPSMCVRSVGTPAAGGLGAMGSFGLAAAPAPGFSTKGGLLGAATAEHSESNSSLEQYAQQSPAKRTFKPGACPGSHPSPEENTSQCKMVTSVDEDEETA